MRGGHAFPMIYAALILAALFLAGCATTWPTDQTEFLHLNTREAAENAGRTWARSGTGREWTTVGFTGSMRPVLNGGEILLLEKYVGQPLRAGSMIVYYRADGVRIVHQVVEVRPGSVYVTGISNRNSDGWINLGQIDCVVARVITFPR